MSIIWSDELNTGIAEIDRQHRRIVDFINKLELARTEKNKRLVEEVVAACIDYAATHFSYEEQLQKDAGYEFAAIHQKVHKLFRQRMSEYQARLQQGDDVAEEILDMLTHWLTNHIRLDDADYVGAVKVYHATILKHSKKRGKGAKGFIRKILG